MEKVAVLNLKGGIGKTTTAVTLAYILARDYGYRVLLTDCDMQGNASKVLGAYDPDGMGTHTIMTGQAQPEFCIRATGYPQAADEFAGQLDIIPANMYLMQANADVLRDAESEQLHRLQEAMERLQRMGEVWKPYRRAGEPEPATNIKPYDVVIFDCALGLDMTVLNALIASDMIIAPVPFGGYEVDGLQQLEEQLEDLRAIKPGLRFKALFTMKQGNKTNAQFYDWLRNESGYDTYNTAIRRSVTVQKAALEKKPLPVVSKRGAATQDYTEFAREVNDDLKGIRKEKERREK